jgi:transcriptional regulator with XRE-family HTH domain
MNLVTRLNSEYCRAKDDCYRPVTCGEHTTRPEKTDMADTADRPQPLSLSAKLLALLRLRRDPDGFTPSAKDVAHATGAGQRKPRLSHGQVNSLLNGTSSNPTSSTIAALAQALDAPAAFLLPGREWDDLAALTVFVERPEVREVIRLMQGVEVQVIDEIMTMLRESRRRAGLPEDVPAIPPPPPGVDQPREGRPRRRLSLEEAAERAADYLEGR